MASQVYDHPEWCSEFFGLLVRLLKMKQLPIAALDAPALVRQLCELIGAHPVSAPRCAPP
jgi:hypothetical protein